MGVSSDSIKGIVRLPMRLGKHIPIVRVDFYVASNFALPADGLLGLPTLKSMRMTISPDNNAVQVFIVLVLFTTHSLVLRSIQRLP